MKPNKKSNLVNVDFLSRKRKMKKPNPLANLLQHARLGKLLTLVR